MNNQKEPAWFKGTEQCVEANLHELLLGVIDKPKALKQIMAHIQTMTEVEYQNPKENTKEEYPDRICRVCGKETTQIFNIDFKMAYICKDCEFRIVKQSINDIYK